MILVSRSLRETKKFAEQMAKKALKMRSSKALVFALQGELGAGKTTFTQGFANALGIKQKLRSPTFVLLKKYAFNKQHLFHIDSYRLGGHDDLIQLGIKDIFSEPGNIVLIEWADRVKKIIPKSAIWLKFVHVDESKRKVTLKGKI